MEIVSVLLLTSALLYCIILIVKGIEKRFINKIKYRQSDILKIDRSFNVPKQIKTKAMSQSSQRLKLNSINVFVAENMAYWVKDNIFYSAVFDGNRVDSSTTRPVDTTNMSKEDIDKMLIILDNIGNENTDDSGSSR